MRNVALMTVGVVAAMGAAFAVPALSDGPANYNSSAYMLGEDDHAEYVQRQIDDDADATTARDRALGYEDGVTHSQT